MKYLDEAGLSYLLSKLKDIYALKGEAGGGGSGEASVPTWHTGTKFSGGSPVSDFGKTCAKGDYYLNTETMELYQCYDATSTKSSMRYIGVLDKDFDLSIYATKEDLERAALGDVDLSDYATKEELADYIPTSERETFATKNDLDGYIPTSRESTFATKAELGDYIPTSERDNFATKADLAQAMSGKSINSAIITLDSDEFENDGQPHAPKVQSVLLDGQPLTMNVDYALVPIHEASIGGTYSVIAIGIGQYIGAASKTWRVKKPTPIIRVSASELTVKGVMGTTDSSITITREGNGRISAESLHPQYATASVVGSTLHVTSVKPGSAVIVVCVEEDDEYSAAELGISVEIQRADGSISVEPRSLSIEGETGTTATATITKTGSGAVSVSSASCVTSQVSGNQLTLTSVSSGSDQLTLSLAETDDYTAASCSLDVQVTIVAGAPKSTLADNSWATIIETAAKGDAQKYWKAGDVAPKVMFTMPIADSRGEPTEQTTTLTCDMRILGFDHDDLDSSDEKYGDSSYNGGKNKAAISFEMVGTTEQKYVMGYAGTENWMRDLNYINNRVLPKVKLDSVLMPNLRTVVKESVIGANSSAVEEDIDYLFILSVAEILGSSAEFPNEGEQYVFYKNGGSKRKQDPSGSYTTWWTRSPAKGESNQFKAYQPLGFSGNTNIGTPCSISICFCI